MKLKELEKRLDKEPDNLALRIQVSGLMREAGRSVEAVELYRSVALAYRDQGRTQQAIAVCRSILEIAPDDAGCKGLLATLQPAPAAEPARRASLDETPLPRPIPHHVMDPTSQKYRLSESDLHLPLQPADRTPTPPSHAVPTSQIDAAAELDTRQRPKIGTDQLAKLDDVTTPGEVDELAPRLTPIPISRDSDADMLTQPRDALPRASDDDLTMPRDRPTLFDDDE